MNSRKVFVDCVKEAGKLPSVYKGVEALEGLWIKSRIKKDICGSGKEKLLWNDLVLVRPSKRNGKDIWEYRQEYLLLWGKNILMDAVELAIMMTLIHGLNLSLAIGKDKMSREGVHASTFFR